MSALDELVKKDLQKYTALEHAIFRVWCEGKADNSEMSDTIILMADQAAAELAEKDEQIEKIPSLQAALSICVQFLTNVNTITEDRQVQLVKCLKDAGRLDLAEAVTLGGFSSMLEEVN